MNKVMAVFNDLWWMTLARQEVCLGQCFVTLNDFVFESCNSAMWGPIPGDEIEDALPFLLVATNLPANHFSPNDFLDMDMLKIVYVDELWFEIWHCSSEFIDCQSHWVKKNSYSYLSNC